MSIEWGIDHFFGRAIWAVVGVAGLCGFLGCLLIWRRLSFLGDALGHGSLLGVVLGLTLSSFSPLIAVMAVCGGIGALLSTIRQDKDLWVMIFSYTSLAGAMVWVACCAPTLRLDPASLLFGDVLSVTITDILWIYGVFLGSALLTMWFWRSLMLMALDWDFARLTGVRVDIIEASVMLCMAASIAVGLRCVGALLVPALLIVPPVAVRPWSKTPEKMIAFSSLFGVIFSFLGVILSFFANLPTGPMVVLMTIVGLVVFRLAAFISPFKA